MLLASQFHPTLLETVLMKKSLIAFAVLSAFAASASAQSSVTIYGVIDAAAAYATNQNPAGDKKASMEVGQMLTSRWGIKGSEDLGGGLKANFNLEGTLANDTGTAGSSFGGGNVSAGTTANLFDRLSWVGLSGDFGSVLLGRNNTLGVESVGLADPLGLAHAPSNPNVAFSALNVGALFGSFGANGGGTELRQNNSIKYLTPMVSGFGGAAMYGFGEKAGDTSVSSYSGLSAYFTDGKSGVAMAYAKLKDTTGTGTLTQWGGGGKLKMDDMFTFKMTYAQTEVDAAAQVLINHRKIAVFGAGVDVALSPATTLTGAYYDTKRSGDVAGSIKVDQFIIMPKYAFSKRTTAYASYTYSKADKTLVDPTKVAGVAQANAAADQTLALGIFGAGQSNGTRLMVGVLHSF
jgi:general bacterial porin, GBP family